MCKLILFPEHPLLLSGQDLLRILSQQDQQASGPMTGASPGDALPLVPDNGPGVSGLPDQAPADEDVQEPVAAAATHLVGKADGAPTDGQDEELRNALAAETEHMVWQSCFIFTHTAYAISHRQQVTM